MMGLLTWEEDKGRVIKKIKNFQSKNYNFVTNFNV